MKVTVKPLKGDTFEVDYEAETLVKDLKASIAAIKEDMAVDQQKLIYAGKILNNDSPMKDYGIKEGEFIVVMVAKAKPPPAAAAPEPAAAPAPAAATAPSGDASAPDATAAANSAMPTTSAGMEAAIEQLTAMGFERPECERCLRAAFGNPDRAVEYLMSGIPAGMDAEMSGGGAPPAGGAAPPGAPAAGGGGGGAPPGGAFPAMPAGGAFPAMPTGGGGARAPAGDLPPALAELRNSPQFAQLAQLVAGNPAMLQQMLPALAQSNPEAAQAVQENPEAFVRMMQEAVAGAGGGGGGGGMGGMGGGMGGGMAGPAQMAQIAQNPEMLQQLISEIAQTDPEAAAQIQANPEAFAQQMAAMAAGGGMGGMGGGGPGGGGGGEHVVRLTQEESEAVARLTELGFDRQMAAQAYLACDKNEEMAANFLFDGGGDD